MYHLKNKGVESERNPNIGKLFYNKLIETYTEKPTPEQILFYTYAILYSNTYRDKYTEDLRVDFPRVPTTCNYDLFVKMEKLGRELVDLHLLESNELNNPIVKFQGIGNSIIEKPRFKGKDERVYINNVQFFEGIDEKLWEYQIGGYQVLRKWLKDKKGRKLSLEDIKHYCKVVTAIKRTIEIQGEIDKLYPVVEKDIIVFEENKPVLEKYTD